MYIYISALNHTPHTLYPTPNTPNSALYTLFLPRARCRAKLGIWNR